MPDYPEQALPEQLVSQQEQVSQLQVSPCPQVFSLEQKARQPQEQLPAVQLRERVQANELVNERVGALSPGQQQERPPSGALHSGAQQGSRESFPAQPVSPQSQLQQEQSQRAQPQQASPQLSASPPDAPLAALRPTSSLASRLLPQLLSPRAPRNVSAQALPCRDRASSSASSFR